MNGLETIFTRRSVRKYTDRKIEKDVLNNILRAGMYAPSAMNSKPWEFIVIKDRERLENLAAIGRHWRMLTDCAAGIVVCGNLKGYRASSKDFFIQDCAISTENMLLAAHAQGVGGVYLGLYPVADRMSKVRTLLNIPKDIMPFSIIALGYPAETKAPHAFYSDDKVHMDEY